MDFCVMGMFLQSHILNSIYEIKIRCTGLLLVCQLIHTHDGLPHNHLYNPWAKGERSVQVSFFLAALGLLQLKLSCLFQQQNADWAWGILDNIRSGCSFELRVSQ